MVRYPPLSGWVREWGLASGRKGVNILTTTIRMEFSVSVEIKGEWPTVCLSVWRSNSHLRDCSALLLLSLRKGFYLSPHHNVHCDFESSLPISSLLFVAWPNSFHNRKPQSSQKTTVTHTVALIPKYPTLLLLPLSFIRLLSICIRPIGCSLAPRNGWMWQTKEIQRFGLKWTSPWSKLTETRIELDSWDPAT